jgi:hypothetical protein
VGILAAFHRLYRSKYLPYLALLLITLCGTGLRVYRLGYKTLWFDEATLYWISQGGLSRLLAQNASLNSAPPLFPGLVALVSSLGHSEAVLRSLPCLAGALAVPAMYALGRRFLSQGGALCAALILAVAPTQVQYSQELREYSLSVLLGILLVVTADIFIEQRSWKSVGLVAVTVLVSILMQYGLALLVLALDGVMVARFLLTRRATRGDLLKWGVIQFAILAASALVYLLSLRQQWQPGGFGAGGHLSGAYWIGSSESALSYLLRQTKDIVDFAFPGYMFLVLFYAGGVVLVFSPQAWNQLIYVSAPFLVVAAAGLTRLYPYHAGRQDLFLTPLLYLTAAFGLDYLLRIDPKKVVPFLFVVLVARKASQGLPVYYSSEGQSGVARIVEHIKTVAQPGDPVYVCRDDPVFRYYLGVRYVMEGNPVVVGNQDVATGPRDYLDQVDTLLRDEGRTWMLISTWCGDMSFLLRHVSENWEVDLIMQVEPDAQLYYAHR